jgi:hypothetical protein
MMEVWGCNPITTSNPVHQYSQNRTIISKLSNLLRKYAFRSNEPLFTAVK